MLDNNLIKFHMNSQRVFFNDGANGTLIRRTIVYASSISQQDIYNYFLLSISRKVSLEFSDIESCICYFKPQELTKYAEGRIDAYWVDGEIHLMTDKNKDNYELLVLSSDLEKQIVFNTLKEQKDLIYANTLEDCWIKRKGIEYDFIS